MRPLLHVLHAAGRGDEGQHFQVECRRSDTETTTALPVAGVPTRRSVRHSNFDADASIDPAGGVTGDAGAQSRQTRPQIDPHAGGATGRAEDPPVGMKRQLGSNCSGSPAPQRPRACSSQPTAPHAATGGAAGGHVPTPSETAGRPALVHGSSAGSGTFGSSDGHDAFAAQPRQPLQGHNNSSSRMTRSAFGGSGSSGNGSGGDDGGGGNGGGGMGDGVRGGEGPSRRAAAWTEAAAASLQGAASASAAASPRLPYGSSPPVSRSWAPLHPEMSLDTQSPRRGVRPGHPASSVSVGASSAVCFMGVHCIAVSSTRGLRFGPPRAVGLRVGATFVSP